MDEEGDAVTRRHRDNDRVWRLAVVITVQSVLVASCLAVTLKVYWDFSRTENKGIFILFDSIGGFDVNDTLKFSQYTSNKINLAENKSKISFSCTGPYVLHMKVCCKSVLGTVASGVLQLQVMGTPVSNFSLQGQDNVCRGLTSTVYIKTMEEASLHFYSSNNLKITEMILGFSYLLTDCNL